MYSQSPGIIWSSDFETGDISQWSPGGGFIRQGPTGQVSVSTSPVHSGRYAAALTIDTGQSSPTGAHAAYLFRWEDLPGREYYYSAWFYIPTGIVPGDWWNIFQWKSEHDGRNDPMVILDGAKYGSDTIGLVMYWRPDNDALRIRWQQTNVVPIPYDTWFHIEGYYKQSTSTDGHVIVWQDGIKIFEVDNLQTALSTDTIHWSINNYAARITPSKTTIYVDDAVISTSRVGPGTGSPTVYPTPTRTPTQIPTVTPTTAPTNTHAPSATKVQTPTVPIKQGDANGDGRVDGVDYTIWLTNYLATTNKGALVGDFNTDGKVDGVDYTLWLNSYLT